MTWVVIIFIAGSFILGSIPFGQLIARFHSGVDLRNTGSGNIGATNVARTLGVRLGVLTLVLDLAKGLAPVLAGNVLLGEAVHDAIPAGAGLAAILGHTYSPFLKFKGGKGVATALGVFVGLIPLALPPALIVFVAVVAKWGYVSAGSMAAALVAPASAWLMGYPGIICAMSLIVTAIIFVRHHENIGRLVRGQENKWRKSG